MDKEHSTILDRCPYIKGIQAGDEGIDVCELNDFRMCDLEIGDECVEWNEIQKEWGEEDAYTEYERAGVMPGNLDKEVNKE